MSDLQAETISECRSLKTFIENVLERLFSSDQCFCVDWNEKQVNNVNVAKETSVDGTH